MHTAGLGLPITAVVSDDQPRIDGVRYVEYRNQPLSDKWNYGMGLMREFDHVMVIGSDNFVPEAYVNAVKERSGFDFIRTEDVVFWDHETNRSQRTKMKRMGAGRVLSRKALEMLDYQPWPFGRDRKLDGGMDRRLKGLDLKEVLIDGPPILDVKSADSMWSYNAMLNGESRDVDLQAIIETHYPLAKMEPKHIGGGWYELPDGSKVKGKENALKEVAETKTEPEEVEDRVLMVAHRNIPPHLAGTERRVYRGREFYTPKTNVRNLESKKLAERV